MLSRIQQGIQRYISKRQERGGALVSFVVIVYDMPVQAQNTVRSLLADYQLDVRHEDYEVLIVENDSANTMSPVFLDSLPPNFSYYLRPQYTVSFF